MKFSIIITTLNPGEGLINTVESVLAQTFRDYEILIKDGGSKDGSVESVENMEHPNVRIIRKEDKSIYDGMNQAVKEAKGEYYIFLNAGDVFADGKVLSKVAKHIVETRADIVYGNMRRKGQQTIIPYPPRLNDFDYYRNVPCHQVCFYRNQLFTKRAYDLKYKVRCDYEHFLWCVYKERATTSHINYPIAIYEGGGYSETKDNLRISAREHEIITEKYIGKKARIYKLVMIITLQPLRQWMSSNPVFSSIYQGIKGMIYGRKD